MDTSIKKTVKASKPQYNMWSNSRFMIKLAWNKEKSVIVFCILQAALAVGMNLLGLYVTPTILKRVESSVPLQELIYTIVIFASALLVVGAAAAYLEENTLFGRVKVRNELVVMVHDKFSATSYPNTGDQGFLKLLDKARMAVSSNNQATEAIWNTFKDILQSSMGFIIYLLLLSSMDIFVVVLTLSTTVAGYFINRRINSWGYRHREEEAAYSHKMNYVSSKVKDFTAAKDVRIFGMQPWLEGVYNSTLRLYEAFRARGERVYLWTNVVDVVLALLRNGIAYAYLISLTIRQGLSASQFLLYFTAIGGFTAWISSILNSLSVLHKQSLDISTLRDYLGFKEIFKFDDGEAMEPDISEPYELELRNVAFRYPEADKDTLRNINLRIRPGEKLAVVGLNGAGKTTLIKLICGFYDPTEGQVLINGQDIRKFNRRDYYRHFSAVFQQFSVLAATIAQNVAQSKDNVDMDKVKECIERAGIRDKIESLPQGYNTNLGREVYEDAVQLSGGELQRLMLARALYKDAPIIILDEPTAALDPIAESDIYNKYNQLTKGRTSVYISHRLASTRFCDRIIFVEDGTIIEEGTHEKLVSGSGRYAELFEIQSRYYREGGDYNEQ